MSGPNGLSPKTYGEGSEKPVGTNFNDGRVSTVLLMSTALACTVLVLLFFNYTDNLSDKKFTTSPVAQTIEYIETQTGIDPEFTVIWLHGLGADGHDFESIVPSLELPEEVPVRFIFPHAPMRPITVNNGMVMRGWYDIVDLPADSNETKKEDRAGLESSMQTVYDLIDQENQRGIPTNNIILAGFSQGGAVALFAGLRLKVELAGIIALSTYLPDAMTTEQQRAIENSSTAIFMGHGTEDPVIPLEIAKLSYAYLENLGYAVEWHAYPMPHSVYPEEIQDIARFLKRQISRRLNL